jgi:capsular polysaccharide transport system permease protein
MMSSPDETGKLVKPRRLALVEPPQVAPPPTDWWAEWLRRTQNFVRGHLWFLIVVALPSVAAVLYYGVIASDQYESEAKFIVRSASQPMVSPIASLLQSTGFSSMGGDSFAVIDYIQSRDIVRKLEQRQHLRSILARPEADFIDRFPPPFMGKSFERLYESYQRFVDVDSDSTTNIATLHVRAFRPDDAQKLAIAILGYSEDLVNRMNARARADTIDLASHEVERYQAQVLKAQADMTAYRLRTSMLDPASSSAAILELVGQLAAQRSSSEEQLSELIKTSPSSPQIEPLRTHIAALDSQIAIERKKVVGGDGSIALKIGEYERLMLQRDFADKGLASATASLETARVEAERKQLYVERVVEPNYPDFALYPHRFFSMLEVMISVLMIYGIGWLITASIREHVGR